MKLESSRVTAVLLMVSLLLFAAAFLIGSGLWDSGPGTADTVYAGLPQSTAAGPVSVLENPGFVVGYSQIRRNPLWVAYRSEAVMQPQFPKRPDFAADPRSRPAVTPDAYGHRGYDRGHMVPNYLISNTHGRAGQRASFLMTNIVPQRPRLNQLLWQRLEEIEVDYMARRWDRLWVTVGPIFNPGADRLASGVQVPQAFYRLWLDQGPEGRPRVLAFRIPQAVRGDEPLSAFLTSVDAIEAATGLDFYPDLAERLERTLEATVADPRAWGLSAVACEPARYHDDWQGRGGIHLNYDRCG